MNTVRQRAGITNLEINRHCNLNLTALNNITYRPK